MFLFSKFRDFPFNQSKNFSRLSFKKSLLPTWTSLINAAYTSSFVFLSSLVIGISGEKILLTNTKSCPQIPVTPITSSKTIFLASSKISFCLFIIRLTLPVGSSRVTSKLPFFVIFLLETTPIIETPSLSCFVFILFNEMLFINSPLFKKRPFIKLYLNFK